jgi:hypothetical protein
MKTFTRVRSIANVMRIIAIAWILSGFCCFFPDRWIDSFLAWFSVEQMPHALPMIYTLRGAGWACVGIGMVIWVVATDIIRYLPIMIAIIALHLIAAPVFFLTDAIIGMPRWWCMMDFGCFFGGGIVPLVFCLWPSPNTALAPTAAALSGSDETINSKVVATFTSPSGDSGSALDR